MPENNPEVKVTLSAEDQGLNAALRQLTEQLKRVDQSQQQLASGSSRAAAAVKGNFTSISKAAGEMANAIKLRIANIPGLGSLGGMFSVRAYEPIGKLAEQAGADLDQTFGKAGPMILGVTGGLVALGAAAAATTIHMMNLAESIENASAATGLSTDQIQAYDEMAKEAGINVQSLQQAFTTLNSQLGRSMIPGTAGRMYFPRVLHEYGVAVQDASGQQRDFNQVMGDFYERMRGIPNAEQRVAAELAAFGPEGRPAVELFEHLIAQGESWSQALQKIQESGVIIPSGQLASLEEAKQDWEGLSAKLRGYLTEYQGAVAYTVLHPLSIFRGKATEQAMFERDLKAMNADQAKAKSGPAVAEIEANQKLIDQTEKRVAVLKAGGEVQLQLEQAEAGLAAARKKGDAELEKSYQREIRDLRELIALESAKKAVHDASTAKKRQETIEQQNHNVVMEASAAIGAEIPRQAKENARLGREAQDQARKATELQIQTLEAEGKTLDAEKLKIQEQADAFTRAGMNAAAVQQYVQAATAKATFANAAADTSQQFKTLAVESKAIELRSQGEEKEREYKSLLAEELPLLKKRVDLEMQLAKASGNVDDMERAQQDFEKYQSLTEQTKQQTKSLADQVKGPIQDSFTTFFANLEHGTETVSDSFRQLGASIAQAFQQVFAQKLVADLFGGGPSKSGGGSGGGLFSGLFGSGSGSGGGLFSSIFGGAKSVASGAGGALESIGSGIMSALSFIGLRTGGHVRGPGSSTSDSIPAMLSDGEYVLNARATRAIGIRSLDAVNFRHLASGGPVTPVDFSRPTLHFAEGGMVAPPGEGGGSIDMHIGLDEGLVLRHLSSKAAGRIVLHHLSNNPKAASKAISRAD